MRLYEILGFVTDWVSRLVVTTLLWALFTCAGGIVLGFMPSTTAMFAVMHKWEQGNSEASMVRTFAATFKKKFIKSNEVGFLLVVPSLLAGLNFYYCLRHPSPIAYLILSSTFAITLILCVLLVYIFPVMSHFEQSPVQQIVLALVFGLRHPFRSLGVMLVIASYVLFMRGLLSFLLLSLLSLFVTRMVSPCFVSTRTS
ncbi:YesL family protein [Alicyclobacillus sp. SO9]|uniref:YesL family protein n=1 Tax=Alicyclobacillus sp. SO9 TaxID=2665646 RepID=UPI0018E73AC2|nr:DUF624 domain-containing protein [Alicyclobacillus sp. SO9]QQE77959.1 DUF624 domain-containing protein [Alicyclobacillus sp. SO9]